MKRKNLEFILRDYLTENKGYNLRKINSSLKFLEEEHVFEGWEN